MFEPAGEALAPPPAAELPPPSAAELEETARRHVPRMLRQNGVGRGAILDGVRDVIEIAYRNLHHGGHVLSGGGADREDRLCAYLYGIAWRWAAHHKRSERKRLSLPIEAAPEPRTPEDEVAREEQGGIVRRILERLPEAWAAAFCMHVVEGQSTDEIAQLSEVNANTVRSRVARARARAKHDMDRLPEDERELVRQRLLAGLLFRRDSHAPDEESPRTRSTLNVAGVLLACGALFAGGAFTPLGARRSPDLITPVNEQAAGLGGGAFSDAASTAAVKPIEAPATLKVTPSPSKTAPSEADMLSAELIWITAAETALQQGSFHRALIALDMHERLFPRGKLTSSREKYRSKAREGKRLP